MLPEGLTVTNQEDFFEYCLWTVTGRYLLIPSWVKRMADRACRSFPCRRARPHFDLPGCHGRANNLSAFPPFSPKGRLSVPESFRNLRQPLPRFREIPKLRDCRALLSYCFSVTSGWSSACIRSRDAWRSTSLVNFRLTGESNVQPETNCCSRSMFTDAITCVSRFFFCSKHRNAQCNHSPKCYRPSPCGAECSSEPCCEPERRHAQDSVASARSSCHGKHR